MKTTGRKILFFFLAGYLTFALSALFSPTNCYAFDASINISPNIINLDSEDHAFGIHTDIPYSIVDIGTVILVCPVDVILEPIVCYADSRGYLIARFNTSDLKDSCELTINDYNALVLEGETKLDPVEDFSGTGDVLIIENQAEMQKGNGPKSMQYKYGKTGK